MSSPSLRTALRDRLPISTDRIGRISRLEKNLERQTALLDKQRDLLRDRLPRLSSGQRQMLRHPDFIEAAETVMADGRTLLAHDRLWVLWQAAHNTAPLGLRSAEVGSYRGGSASFLADALRRASGAEPAFDVVDTFEGHAPGTYTEGQDRAEHRPERGEFRDTSYEDVKRYLSGFAGLEVHQGAFHTVEPRLVDHRYGLAHVDVDLYEPTVQCLRFFADRMPASGVIVVDDYGAPKCPGIREATDEFLAGGQPFFPLHPLTEQLVLVKTA